MPKETTVISITVYAGFGNRQSAKDVPVTDSDTLADVREWISKELTLQEIRTLLIGDAPRDGEPQIPGFAFYNQDDTRISMNQERELPAVSFGKNSNKRLLIKPRHYDNPHGLLGFFSLAVLGWTPPVWFSIKKLKDNLRKDSSTWQERAKALFVAIIFALIFLLDFLDAVVDLLIFFKLLMEGKEGGNRTYGILLGVMTILARMLAGWYGVAHQQITSSSDYYDDQVEKLLIATYFFVELSVFMMEDGAAILYLAHTDTEYDILRRINTILTSISGVCFVCYNLFSVRTFYESLTISVTKFQHFSGHTRSIGDVDNACCKSVFIVLLSLSSLGLAVSMVVLLIQEVWRKDDSESSFSENETLQRQWNIVYGVGVGLCFLVSASLIRSFPVIEEWVLLRRDYLQEYRTTYPDDRYSDLSVE